MMFLIAKKAAQESRGSRSRHDEYFTDDTCALIRRLSSFKRSPARCDCLSYSKIEGNLQERNLQMTDEIQGSRLASTTELGSCLNDWRKIVRLKFGQLRHTKCVRPCVPAVSTSRRLHSILTCH
ncbi:uncharacterized protein LOC111268397 isoform X3 [Varroa jacobsoni]|uniref:uncharacterized protein LOC111268397 isoform X3 n=1 Tax=Varroa jacobsoni TaxID=62625 RepID=UPI000BF29D4A|nr:uncharacterized protein LOC111268397 isoform X3 [Varroa jacobsoni]